VDLLPAVKKWLRAVSPGQAAMAAGLVVSLGVLVFPQNRGSAWQSVSGLAFSPNGKQLAIGVYSGRFRAVRERWYFSDTYHTAALADVADLERATVLGRDNRPGIFNILPEVFIGPSVAFSADGDVLVSAGFDGTLNFWDTASRRRLFTETIEQLHLRTLASLTRGDRYVAAFRRWLYVGNFHENAPLRTLEVGVNVLALAPAPDGSRIAVGGLGALDLEVWDTTDAKRLERLEPPPPPDTGDLPPSITALAWLPDGKTLVAANDKTVEITDLSSRKVTDMLPERLVLSLAVSPDGKLLATGRFDGVTIWDLPARKKTTIHFAIPAVESLQFSADGHRLAAGSTDGTVRVWNLPNFNLAGTWTFTRPSEVGLAEFLRLIPLALWIGVFFYLRRLRRASRPEFLLRV
jgi:WD40 repeat protein